MSVWAQLPNHLRVLAANSPSAVLLETSRFDLQNRYSYLFLKPVEVATARTSDELDALFDWIETARQRGLHLAGYFGYECGYYLDYKLKRSAYSAPATEDSLPMAWLGAYSAPVVFDHASGSFLNFSPAEVAFPQIPDTFADETSFDISESDYSEKILAIKRYIGAGDTYQVNFTEKVTVRSKHDAAASFSVLSAAQPVAYSALLHVGDAHILSLSPELFFRIHGGSIVTRPMKGTMSRGLDLAEDEQQAARLHADEKNRSEHVMIVDLLRNDLGRICRMGSVRADELFTVERYKTLFQMTSTITGELRGGLTFREIFHALFPSGSITGAPKLRTMQIIREFERRPRGVYTGAIGHIAPNGDAEFNVAIRTLVLRNGIATMGVGGGIVADSDPASEYRECELKASFLTRPTKSFQLIETMLFDGRTMPFLSLHLERLASSAKYFDFVFDPDAIQLRLAELGASLAVGVPQRIRLLLDATGQISLTQATPAEEKLPLTLRISAHRVNAEDLFLRHKTTQRELYDHEYASARDEGYDEVLFLNQREELTEGAISTLFVQIDGKLLTPPLSSGVLPGVLRRHILATRTDASECSLTLEDFQRATAVFLGNSVRGLRPAGRIELAHSDAAPIFLSTQPV